MKYFLLLLLTSCVVEVVDESEPRPEPCVQQWQPAAEYVCGEELDLFHCLDKPAPFSEGCFVPEHKFYSDYYCCEQ